MLAYTGWQAGCSQSAPDFEAEYLKRKHVETLVFLLLTSQMGRRSGTRAFLDQQVLELSGQVTSPKPLPTGDAVAVLVTGTVL